MARRHRSVSLRSHTSRQRHNHRRLASYRRETVNDRLVRITWGVGYENHAEFLGLTSTAPPVNRRVNSPFSPMNKLTMAVISSSIMFLLSAMAQAGSATWDLNPGSGDWNTATNWTPATVPNGSADTATFDLSNTTGLSISANTEVNGIVFDSNASFNPFTITASPTFALTISGVGITNNSG